LVALLLIVMMLIMVVMMNVVAVVVSGQWAGATQPQPTPRGLNADCAEAGLTFRHFDSPWFTKTAVFKPSPTNGTRRTPHRSGELPFGNKDLVLTSRTCSIFPFGNI